MKGASTQRDYVDMGWDAIHEILFSLERLFRVFCY